LSTIVRLTQTDCVSTWGGLSPTAIFIRGYLHSFIHVSLQEAQLSHNEHAMSCVTFM